VVQWFTPNDPVTARYLSERIGKTTVTTRSTSMSTGKNRGGSLGTSARSSSTNYSNSDNFSENTNEAGVDFMSLQDIMELPEHFQIVTLTGFKYPILATRERYYEWDGDMRIFRDLALPDPFHWLEANDAKPRNVYAPTLFASTRAPFILNLEIGSESDEFVIDIRDPIDKKYRDRFAWDEPIRIRRDGKVLPAVIMREAYLITMDGKLMIRCNTINEKKMKISFVVPMDSLQGFQIEKLGSRKLPEEYLVAEGHMLDPEDWVLWAVAGPYDWPLAITSAPFEQVLELKNRFAGTFLRARKAS